MKKTTTKTAKTSAATPAPKVAAKTVKKPAAPRKKPAAPAVKAGPAKALVTVITAKIDVGFGNTLYIRGEGPGLSWETGALMDCVKDDSWSITLPETSKSIIYKLLLNDLTWSAGPDYVVEPGKKTVVSPVF